MAERVEHLAEGVTLYLGDCLDVMPTLADIRHVISDPPYEDELHKAMGRKARGIRIERQRVAGVTSYRVAHG